MEEQGDMVDFLLKLTIFATFVVFGICIWLIKKERDRKGEKRKEERNKGSEETSTNTED